LSPVDARVGAASAAGKELGTEAGGEAGCVTVGVGVGVGVGLGVSVRNKASFPTEPRLGVTPDKTVVEAIRDLVFSSPPTRETSPVLVARDPE
jgi:hypothetical protein